MLNKFTDLWFGKPNLNPTALPDSLNTSTGPSDEEQFQIAELEATESRGSQTNLKTTTCFQPSSGCSTGHHCANLADQKSIQSAHGGRTEASQCDFAQEILIAVFGMTGTGKTTLIEKISGQSLAVGHNLRSCTANIEKIHCQIGPYKITLVDTPGFDDTDRGDADILDMIASWLGKSYHEGILLSGIIYLYRISDIRMSGSSLKNLKLFRKLCGSDNMKSVSLVTSMWDKVSLADGERRERDLVDSGGFWQAMISSGCSVKRHDGSIESAKNLVLELVEKSPVVLKLQQEIADGKTLIETEAGVSLNEELVRVQKKHQEELLEVKQEMERARAEDNKALEKKLEKHYAEVFDKLKKKAEEQERLHSAKTNDLQNQIRVDSNNIACLRVDLTAQSEVVKELQQELQKEGNRIHKSETEVLSLQEKVRQAEDRERELKTKLKEAEAERYTPGRSYFPSDPPKTYINTTYECNNEFREEGCGTKFTAHNSQSRVQCPSCGRSWGTPQIPAPQIAVVSPSRNTGQATTMY